MKRRCGAVALCAWLACAGWGEAATRYVSPGGGNVAPYTNWATAATNIQDAVDVSVDGDEVWVTNGVYDTGYRTNFPGGSGVRTRVVVSNAITLRSVNGAGVTAIRGNQPNGNSAVRCVYLTNGATLIGFTLTNGATWAVGTQDAKTENGGGVWCEGTNARVVACVLATNTAYCGGGGAYQGTLSNCVFRFNAARVYGGGAYQSTLQNCELRTNYSASVGGGACYSAVQNSILQGNRAAGGGGSFYGSLRNCLVVSNTTTSRGGGAQWSTSENCTFVNNRANSEGGGVFEGTHLNSIIYYNSAPSGSNALNAVCTNCCTIPMPSGTGNLTAAPGIASLTDPQLLAGAAAIDAGTNQTWMAGAADLAGRARINGGVVDIGAYEFHAGIQTGALTVACTVDRTNAAAGYVLTFTGTVQGAPLQLTWVWGDGQTEPNQLIAAHAFSATGVYAVVFRASNLTTTASATVTVTIAAADHYVAPGGAHVAPYASWANAATTIQAAVDAASAGAVILVSNGVYGTGGKAGYPSGSTLTNRLVVSNAMTVRSLNGPAVTAIVGARDASGTNGPAAVRGVYLAAGAQLIGFTISNGATRALSAYNHNYESGGGVWCTDDTAVVSNCVVSGNLAGYAGGGVYNGRYLDCVIAGNGAGDDGGGAFGAVFEDTSLLDNTARFDGGGAVESVLSGCVLEGNEADSGGGAASSSLADCVLSNNAARSSGGGVYLSGMTNGVLANNTAATSGGGAYGGTTRNARFQGNSAGNSGGGARNGTLVNCALSGNVSGGLGGGSCDVTVQSCAIVANTAIEAGGGVSGGTVLNSIVYHNRAPAADNATNATCTSSCTVPLAAGTGNTTNDPKIVSVGNPRLLAGSPCVDTGTNQAWMALATDLAGRARIQNAIVDMGAYEYEAAAQTGTLAVAATADPAVVLAGQPARFVADIQGAPQQFIWTWGDGQGVTNAAVATHAYAAAGSYNVVLRATNVSGSASTTVTVQVVTQTVYYVSPAGAHVAPFATWANAATTIQAAVDAAPPGAQVWVSNGVYATGGRAYPGVFGHTNRVVVDKAVTVRSLNGAAATTIQGARDASGGVGPAAVRCVYLGDGAVLSGFTLAGGATADSENSDGNGGGVWCANRGVVISNCVVASNAAAYAGGGVYQGAVFNCTLSGNSADRYGGGASGSRLEGCVVSNNATGYEGGGVNGSELSRCTLVANTSADIAGGAYASQLSHCWLLENQAEHGGGAYRSVLTNCVVSGNWASDTGGGVDEECLLFNCTLTDNEAQFEGGGSWGGTLVNCLVYYNRAPSGPNFYSGIFTNSCTTPEPRGTNNLTADPVILSVRNPQLRAGSPCIDAGVPQAWMGSGVDIAGRARINGGAVDIGAFEYYSGTQTGALTAACTASWTMVAPGFPVRFTAHIGGNASSSAWTFGDGQGAANQPVTTHAFATAGTYSVVLRASNAAYSAAATVTVQVATQTVYYVSPTGAHTAPFASWANAATTIQAAVNVAPPGSTVLVNDGRYATGGISNWPVRHSLSNRVAVYKPLALRSVNGPAATIIAGAFHPTGTNGSSAVRCVALVDGATLSGFTLTNGATTTDADESLGGGVFCLGTNVVVSNCVVAGNASATYGGGTYGGTFYNCTVASNRSTYYAGGVYAGMFYDCTLDGNQTAYRGGGAMDSELHRCILLRNVAGDGGGASDSTLHNCTVSYNRAPTGRGGGVHGGRLYSCLLTGNLAGQAGGAAYGNYDDSFCLLDNCTVVGNLSSVNSSGSYEGGGTYWSMLRNCIVWNNYRKSGSSSYTLSNTTLGTNVFTCTTPLPAGAGNFTNDPLFVASGTGYGTNYTGGDLHLQDASPCLNTGTNQSWMADARDLDGNPRLGSGRVDMGAYERQGPALSVTPTNRSVGATAGSTTFSVENAGIGVLAYVATESESWLSISDGGSGTNSGTMTVEYEANPNATARTGTVTVTATGAAGSPATLKVVQAAGSSPSGWDAGYTDLGGGWRRLSWFGDYVQMAAEGWIWHNKHGFFYVANTSTPGNVWLYANDMGWLYTGNTLYPFLYRSSDGAWLWYNGSTNPRWFRNMTAGTWEYRP